MPILHPLPKKKSEHANLGTDSDSQVEDKYQPDSFTSSQANESHSQHQPIHPTCAAPTHTHCQAQSNGAVPSFSREAEALLKAVLPTIHNYTTFCGYWMDAYIKKLRAHQ
ncbi:hypothetical protein CROQUDRAFT_493587 [Cronartium quercuum f. sp. fusiforme G11]|uniref:Uncharacterized protein n=1 Tax=Cronartium quercuum f. sp. fusiforme G11 TaxID=708437 RepID=A0A9P6TCQ4_9BASI|nr:hypothetical protein CROQUDRAFT_493587 [Cronartium quercuum f. sp. fusiforme G11]